MGISFREQCESLRREGRTLTEIVGITGRAKSSIYPHIKGIPLGLEKQNEIRRASGARIRRFAVARTGKSTRAFKPFDTWTPRNALLLAHLIFDGELSHGKCVYNNRSEALIARIEDLMGDIYAFEPKRYFNTATGVHRIGYYNVALGAYLKGKSQDLLDALPALPNDIKREFLRGFFDDEGCMDFRPVRNTRKVRGYQKDMAVLVLIQGLLADFDIQARLEAPNEVVITGKEQLLRFQSEINFSSGVRINGNRPNSIWKEHLEKRDLLERAIASYRN